MIKPVFSLEVSLTALNAGLLKVKAHFSLVSQALLSKTGKRWNEIKILRGGAAIQEKKCLLNKNEQKLSKELQIPWCSFKQFNGESERSEYLEPAPQYLTAIWS